MVLEIDEENLFKILRLMILIRAEFKHYSTAKYPPRFYRKILYRTRFPSLWPDILANHHRANRKRIRTLKPITQRALKIEWKRRWTFFQADLIGRKRGWLENLQLRFSNSSRRDDIDWTGRFYRMSGPAYLSIARKKSSAGKRLIKEPPIKLPSSAPSPLLSTRIRNSLPSLEMDR